MVIHQWRNSKRPSQLLGVKRKSKFADAPSSNSAIQILNKPAGAIAIQQEDDYKGFVPPEYQTQDYSYHQNYNSGLYQPVQEQPSMTESQHYAQIWNEYKVSMSSGPQYSSHSTYLHNQVPQAPPGYPPPQAHAGYAYYPPPPHPGAPVYPPAPPPAAPKKSRWSSRG